MIPSLVVLEMTRLLFELHHYGRSQEELREELHFYPCGQLHPNSEDFDSIRLLRIIGYSQCLEIFPFVEIVGKFLRGADFIDVTLNYANFYNANLNGAQLVGTQLVGVNLNDAQLVGANLRNADLTSAGLRSADLRCADFRDADLTDADLRNADFRGADFRGARLSGVYLGSNQWDNTPCEDAQWSNTIGLHEAREVPEDLQQNPEFAAAVAQSEAASQEEE